MVVTVSAAGLITDTPAGPAAGQDDQLRQVSNHSSCASSSSSAVSVIHT
jgi:hypothetical protein